MENAIDYEVVSHLTHVGVPSGLSALDLNLRTPWLYFIFARSSRILYIGETGEGLATRLFSHFGPYATSSLRKNALKFLGKQRIVGPFLVVAARLPSDLPIAGESKQIRMVIESLLHERVAVDFILKEPYSIVSTASSTLLEETASVRAVADAIYSKMSTVYDFLRGITTVNPLNVVILGERSASADCAPAKSLDQMIKELEVLMFEHIVGCLKREHKDNWWTDGVPEPTRISCATRKESERNVAPAEAYLTFIDMRSIMQKNWQLFSGTCEAVSANRGKDRATEWLQKLNEIRNLIAHPLKQCFIQIAPTDETLVSTMLHKFRELVKHASPPYS